MSRRLRDAMVLVAELDGGDCPLCGCAIFTGDVIYLYPEIAIKEHVCCRNCLKRPSHADAILAAGPLFA